LADGILLERAGVPTASICTGAFASAAQAMAVAYGFPGFEHVLTEHPIASLTLPEIRTRVAEIVPHVLEILGVERNV
jgi:hypothetical protein